MEWKLHPFLPLMIIVPVLMSCLAFLKFLKYRKKQFKNLSEFYLSVSFSVACSWLLLPLGSAYVILSMLPWMWALRTFGLVTGDISGQHFFSRLHYIILALGGIISIVFLSFDFTLPMVTAPFSLSIGLIGLTFIFQSYSKERGRSYSYLQHFVLFLVLAFFITRISFPIFVSNGATTGLMPIIDSYLLFSYCAFLYPIYGEIVFERHERFLENVLYTRNKQLLSHSGFSEYKILSAGLSHEINNALTIINAKIVRLIQGKSKDLNLDLHQVQAAANRIVRSIRGLREFIYPHEFHEVLDLGEVVNEVLALYGQRISNHGVKVIVDSLNNRLVKGQRVQLAQVFLSLINNSVEAIDQLEEKWIRITGQGEEKFVKIIYKDSSLSKAEQIMHLLKDPFYASRDFMDNDIRIVQAKEIVEKHGGSLVCGSVDNFSTFIITFPAAEAIRSTSMELQNKIDEIKELH